LSCTEGAAFADIQPTAIFSAKLKEKAEKSMLDASDLGDFVNKHLIAIGLGIFILFIAMTLWSYEQYNKAKITGVVGVVVFGWAYMSENAVDRFRGEGVSTS
tara:strand:- start:3496 stop:3801 length:306 start_codon:yes stop_codon:yes gene_type:complete